MIWAFSGIAIAGVPFVSFFLLRKHKPRDYVPGVDVDWLYVTDYIPVDKVKWVFVGSVVWAIIGLPIVFAAARETWWDVLLAEMFGQWSNAQWACLFTIPSALYCIGALVLLGLRGLKTNEEQDEAQE